MMLYKQIVSKKLQILLKEKFKTRKNMAEKLGLHESQLGKWISGKIAPSLESLEIIIQKCDLPLEYFFVDKVENKLNIDEYLFDRVFDLVYTFFITKNIPLKGSNFLAYYEYIVKELENNKNEKIEDIFNRVSLLILKIIK